MCKHRKNLIAFVLTFIMVFTMAVPAFASGQVPNTGEVENADAGTNTYYTAEALAARKGYLYRHTSEILSNVPTDLDPTPLPEDLNLDPLAYWEETIPRTTDANDENVEKTTRPTREIYREIRQLVNELTAGLTTSSDKFTAIDKWVEDNITYSTDNRTDNVYWIYERRYGACTEIANMLYFMATMAGVKAAILVGGNHASTAALDENDIWFGDCHSAAVGKPVAGSAFYVDGMDLYCCSVERGITKYTTFQGKRKPIDASSVNFIDVPEDAWYADAVKWAITWGVTNGTSENTFSPDKLCTNDEILTFLYRAADDHKFDADRSQPFTPKNDWAADALKWAYYKGITLHDYDATEEDVPCTRDDAVYYIWEAFGRPNTFTQANFVDLDSRWDQTHIYWAVEQGIVTGTSPTMFSPNLVCNRATIVTLLYRAYKESKEALPVH